MLIGYVSDEKYVALADVLLELVDSAGASWEARSRASGSVHADVPAGDYVVTLQKPGFGSKRVRLRLPPGEGARISMVHDLGRVLETSYAGDCCEMDVEIPESLRQRLTAFIVTTPAAR